MEFKKEQWIEKLRVIATFAVILIHVISETYANGLPNVSLYRNLFNAAFIQSITRWSVPVFCMISGYLLLDPNKKVSLNKIKKYICRMVIVLLTFGLGYCFIESFVKYKSSNILFVLKDAIINLLSGNSWGHMWYIYMLIGLYIITPILRAFISIASDSEYCFVMICLFILTIIIPTINIILNLKITNFYITFIPYIFYYLFGNYVKKINIKTIYVLITGIVSFLILFAMFSIKIKYPNNLFGYDNSFIALNAMSIFYLYNKNHNTKNSKIVSYLSKRSFYIYLIHPLFLNILSKGLNIHIIQFPFIMGETLFFIVALVLSLITYELVSRLPIFRKII